MTLTVRILGVELLHVDLSTDEGDDTERDLSGGELSGRGLDVGAVDVTMGFAGGRECDRG